MDETNFFRDDKRISKAAFIDTSTKEVIIEAYFIPKSLSKFPSFFGSNKARRSRRLS